MREEAAKDAVFLRRTGMESAKRQEVGAYLAGQSDWWGLCRRCGARVQGTPKELLAHRGCKGAQG